jgi:hypothetical protein
MFSKTDNTLKSPNALGEPSAILEIRRIRDYSLLTELI